MDAHEVYPPPAQPAAQPPAQPAGQRRQWFQNRQQPEQPEPAYAVEVPNGRVQQTYRHAIRPLLTPRVRTFLASIGNDDFACIFCEWDNAGEAGKCGNALTCVIDEGGDFNVSCVSNEGEPIHEGWYVFGPKARLLMNRINSAGAREMVANGHGGPREGAGRRVRSRSEVD